MIKMQALMAKLDMERIGSLVQNFEDDGEDRYEDLNNIRHIIKNKGDVSDRIIGYGLNINTERYKMDEDQRKNSGRRDGGGDGSDRAKHPSRVTGDPGAGSELQDPTLQSLELFNRKDLPGHLRCENLKQVLEYIHGNKIQLYKGQKGSFESLFLLLIHNPEKC